MTKSRNLNYLKIDEGLDTQEGAEVAEAGGNGASNTPVFQWKEFSNQQPGNW